MDVIMHLIAVLDAWGDIIADARKRKESNSDVTSTFLKI